MLQCGDMTHTEALRIATRLGAQSLALARDLGSLETRKIARLIVLDSNPLTDIRESSGIAYAMKQR